MDCLGDARNGRSADGDAPLRRALRSGRCHGSCVQSTPDVTQCSILAGSFDRSRNDGLPEMSHRNIALAPNVGEIVGNVWRSRDRTVSIEADRTESKLAGITSIVVARRGHEMDRHFLQFGQQASLLAALP